jgi:hypothetical protein
VNVPVFLPAEQYKDHLHGTVIYSLVGLQGLYESGSTF